MGYEGRARHHTVLGRGGGIGREIAFTLSQNIINSDLARKGIILLAHNPNQSLGVQWWWNSSAMPEDVISFNKCSARSPL